MEDLAQSWKRLTLSEREGPGCNLTVDHSITEYSIAAMFLTKRAINVDVIARTFTPLWRAKNGFKIQRFGEHKLLFTFDNKEDVDRIITSEPWSFDKHLVVMQRYDSESSLQDIKFDRTTLWVQVHGLPLKYMNFEAGKKICEVVGEVIQPSNTRWFDAGEFIRVKVSIDLSLPLCRGRLISLSDGKERWVSFKYERLPNICYWCGRLTHDDRDCDLWIESEGTLKTEQRAFGPHLRASPFVATRKSAIQVPGYYAEKKKTKTNIPAEQSSGEPPVPGGEVETEHSREEQGSNVHSVTAPLMSNVSIGINSIPKSGTSSSTANYSAITGELIGATIFGKESIGLETRERGAGRVTEAADFNNKNNSRDGSSEAHESHPSPREHLVAPRAFPSNENKRILPSWTRRSRGSPTASHRQQQPISGQKRRLEEAAEFSGVFAKRIHASQIDEQEINLLVEADSQPRQQP